MISVQNRVNLRDIGRMATLVIAASDSQQKDKADYICDGTNDEVEINAAIAALNSTNGMIFLTEGTFNILNPIDFSGKGNIQLKGTGASTIINNQDTSGKHAINAANADTVGPSTVRYLSFSDFYVKGNTSSGDGLHFERVDCLKVNGVIAEKNGGYGIYYFVNAWSVGGDNAYADTLITNSFFLTNEKYGIFCKNLHEPLIGNCHIEENKEGGIWHENGYNLVVNGCSIEDNVNDKGVVIYANGNICPLSAIVGNTFENDIVLKSSATHAPYAVTIQGNTIDAAIIQERSSGHPYVNQISIVGNTVRYNARIYMEYGKFVTVASNVFGGVTSPLAVSSAIQLQNCSSSVIIGNVGRGYSPFIHLSGASEYDLILSNNTFQVESAGQTDKNGIFIDGTLGDIKIYNNIMRKYATTDMTAGIKISVGSTNVSCKENSIYNATTAIDDVSGNANIANNVGYVTKKIGSSTGTGAQQTIAHSLAVTPTKVILWNIENGANAYQSVAADNTNIYITAVNTLDYGWEVEACM